MSDSKKPVDYVYQVSYELGNGRVINITGNIHEGTSKERMNEILDEVISVFDRQRTKILELPILEEKLHSQKDQYDRSYNEYLKLGEKDKLTSQDKMNLQNLKTNVDGLHKSIQEGEKIIAEQKKKVS